MLKRKNFNNAVLIYFCLLIIMVVLNMINEIDILDIVYLVSLLCGTLKCYLLMSECRK